jgi:hypothetical protein
MGQPSRCLPQRPRRVRQIAGTSNTDLLPAPPSLLRVFTTAHHHNLNRKVSTVVPIAAVEPGLRAGGKSGLAHDVVLLIWLNRAAATARPPTLVCRPSSRALRLQVPLPTICERAPLDLYVLFVVECAALLVSPSRSNRRLAHACTHA